MADYLVTDTELTSVANAIRTKGGTTASLSFPTGFADAIGALSGATVTTFFDEDVTFTPDEFGLYVAEFQLTSVPITFPTYDADFSSYEYNVYLSCDFGPNDGIKMIGYMVPDTDKSLMYLVFQFDADGDCQLYSDGTLKFVAGGDWAQNTTHFTFQLVEI